MKRSERGVPLIYQARQGVWRLSDYPVLTIENAPKWGYNFHIVRPEGVVREVTWPEAIALAPCMEPHANHVPNPVGMFETAYHLGADLDLVSLEVVIGRWHVEIDPNDRFDDLFGGVCSVETYRTMLTDRWKTRPAK